MPKMSEWQNYGGLSVTDNSAAEPLVDGTARRVTAWDNAMPTSAQVTSDPVTDNMIQVSDAGDYDVVASFSFEGQGKIYEFELYVNALPTGFRVQRKLSGTGDSGAAGIVGIVSLAIDDEVSLTQRSLNGGNTVTILNAQMKLERLV